MINRFELNILPDQARSGDDPVQPYPGFAELCKSCEKQDLSIKPLPCKLVDFQGQDANNWDFIGPYLRRRKNGIEECDRFVKNSVLDLDASAITLRRTTRQKPP